MEFKSLKDEYIDLVVNKLTIIKDDLTDNETEIINIGYDLLKEKLEDIKIINDELKRVSLELANLKSSLDDNDYPNWDNGDEDN
jgi:hypothetical protein